jgi:hypothetical protein
MRVSWEADAKRQPSAEFALASVDNPAGTNWYLTFGGPVAESWRDIVATCGETLKRDLPPHFSAPGEPLPGQPQEIPGTIAALERYDSVLDMGETAPSFGMVLTPLEVVGRLFWGGGS